MHGVAIAELLATEIEHARLQSVPPEENLVHYRTIVHCGAHGCGCTTAACALLATYPNSALVTNSRRDLAGIKSALRRLSLVYTIPFPYNSTVRRIVTDKQLTEGESFQPLSLLITDMDDQINTKSLIYRVVIGGLAVNQDFVWVQLGGKNLWEPATEVRKAVSALDKVLNNVTRAKNSMAAAIGE